MTAIFVDTSGFIALRNRNDSAHAAALAFEHSVVEQKLRLVTSNFVLDETYTWLRSVLGHHHAVAFGTAVQQSRIVEIAIITPDIERTAWKIFVQYADKDFSYTDCTSFALMRHLRLDTAFSFDHHFVQFGLKVVPHDRESGLG